MPEYIYQTKDGRLGFDDNGSWISIWRHDILWGVPQGDWALRAVIKDLKELQEENEQLKQVIKNNKEVKV